METIKITCVKCGKTMTVKYTTSLGHAITDENLAVDRAIQKHICCPMEK